MQTAVRQTGFGSSHLCCAQLALMMFLDKFLGSNSISDGVLQLRQLNLQRSNEPSCLQKSATQRRHTMKLCVPTGAEP